MESVFEIQYQPGCIKMFERQVLTSGSCDVFLPVAFIIDNEKEIARYNCSGYKALCCVELRKTTEVLDCLEKVLLGIAKASEYLLEPEKISLSCSTVYYNAISREIKIAYVPKSKEGFSITDFLTELDQKFSGPGLKNYLKSLEMFAEKHSSLSDLINQIAECKRDAYICGAA